MRSWRIAQGAMAIRIWLSAQVASGAADESGADVHSNSIGVLFECPILACILNLERDMEEFRGNDVVRDLAPIVARDELHDLLALSGSVRWGVTSGLLLRPLPASTAGRTGRTVRGPLRPAA